MANAEGGDGFEPPLRVFEAVKFGTFVDEIFNFAVEANNFTHLASISWSGNIHDSPAKFPRGNSIQLKSPSSFL